MKCLTLTQPWASLVVSGMKLLETRSWNTHYRGPLLIHAARAYPNDARALFDVSPFKENLRAIGLWKDRIHLVPCGVIVGMVDLIDVMPVEEFLRSDYPFYPTELAFGDYSPARYIWKLSNYRMFVPTVPYRGRQRIFNVPDDLVKEATS